MAKKRALFRHFEHQFKLCVKLKTKRMKDRYRCSWISHWKTSGMNNSSSGMLPVVSHLEIRTKRSQFDFTLENCVSHTRSSFRREQWARTMAPLPPHSHWVEKHINCWESFWDASINSLLFIIIIHFLILWQSRFPPISPSAPAIPFEAICNTANLPLKNRQRLLTAMFVRAERTLIALLSIVKHWRRGGEFATLAQFEDWMRQRIGFTRWCDAHHLI